ncbi:MAG TPA: GNAT family N-acetyltransferase [Caulobacteraceae bacterium]|nr:GNAT family N-acetyltransferase [Caulobacteraceae bacterium]
MKLVPLAERPDLIAPLAAAYEAEWQDWYGPDGPGDARADLLERARTDVLPIALVLVDGHELLGALALTGPTFERYQHLSPWVGGGWTWPDRRGQGLGALMLQGAAEHARRLGFARLHIATATAVSLLQRQGWTLLETFEHEGEMLSLFVLELT